jgi:hypothetical protein
VGKKKHGYQDEAREAGKASAFERAWESLGFRVAAGAAVVLVSAAIAIVVVSLLGGDDLSKPETRLAAPPPIGPAPAIERSAAADVLASKTWDAMSEEERQLIESEVNRVFANASFRTSSLIIVANDIERRDGKTVLSRLYVPAEAPSGQELAQRILFYCETPDGTLQSHRYLISTQGSQHSVLGENQNLRSWNTILSDVKWIDVKDLGWKDIDGRRAHGFEVGFVFSGAGGSETPSEAGAGRALYWFDVENARLLERTKVVEDPLAQEQSTYRLDYRERSPVVIPDNLERPACVQDILARVQ